MNEIGISNKIKYTLLLAMVFFIIVLGGIYFNMRKTVVESRKETRMLSLLKNLEGIQLNSKIFDDNKHDFLKTGQNTFFNDYQKATNVLRQENNELLQLSIKNNFEKENILKLSNTVNKKILSANKAVEIKRFLENDSSNIFYYDSISNSYLKFIIFETNNVQKNGIAYLQNLAEERESYTKNLTRLLILLGLLFLICIILVFLYLKKDINTSQHLNKILAYNSTLLNNISDAIITTDNKWKVTDWNSYAEELYGYSEAEAKGKNIVELFNSNENNFLQHQNSKTESIHFHKDGSLIHVEVGQTLIKNNNDKITGSISVVRNITERVKLQERLKMLSENLQEQVNVKAAELNFFYERIADAFIALDNDWNYTYLNKRALELHGVNQDEILGKNMLELYPDMVNEPFYEALLKAKSTQEPQRCELYFNKEDKWFSDLIYPAKDGISVYYHEITDKKKSEIELKKAHEKLNFHISNTPLATIEFDSEMNILQWSKKATEIFEWTAQEVIGTGFKMEKTIYPDDIQIAKDALIFGNTNAITNNVVKNRNVTKSGKIIYCEWYNSILRNENGNITGMLCLVKDVTKDMLTQIELINTEAKFRGMVEQSMVGVYIRQGYKLLYVNPRFAEIFGYAQEELYNNFDSLNLLDDEFKHMVSEKVEAYANNKISSHHYEFKGKHKDGKILYGEVYGTLTKYNGEDAIIGTIIDITDRKIASQKLRISDESLKFSNERFELVAKATNDGLWDWNIENDILKGNESFSRLMDIEEDSEINYEYFIDRVHPEDRERLNANFKKAVVNRASLLTEEFRLRNKNGSYKIIFDRAYILYKDKIAYRMLGAMQDITANKESEKKLFLEKELSDSIINSLPGVFYLFTKEGKYFRWNKNFETVTGYNSEEIIKLNPLEFFIEEDQELIKNKIENVFAIGSDMVEANFKTKSGKLIPYYFTGMYIKYENEDCIMGVGLDISEKVNSQKELVESEQKFRTLVQQASDGIIITDEDGNFKQVNESAAILMGYSKNELDNMTTDDIFFEESGIKKPLKFNSMVKGAVVISEHVIKRKGGKFINVEVSAKQLSDGRYQRIIRDITERTMVEEALRISEKKYRLLFNDNPLPMWISSLHNNTFLDVNNAAFLSYGYTKEEFLQMTLSDINVTPLSTSKTPTNNDNKEFINHKDIWLHKKKDGSVIKVNLINHDIIYEGKPAVLSLANDVTAKFDAEENLQRSNDALRDLASHLETIRENERSHMAREIHDELGQQLTGLKMDISWLTKKIKSEDKTVNDKIKDTIKLIDNTVITVRRIATQLRPSILDDLGLIAAMEWQSEEFEKRSEIKSIFNSNVSQITVKPDISIAIFRIFQESLTNVLRHSKATQVSSFFRLNDDTMTLLIEDNGVGFNEEEIVHKKTLGLLGMKERIQLINGTYEINGNAGKGTSVIITVPLNNVYP